MLKSTYGGVFFLIKLYLGGFFKRIVSVVNDIWVTIQSISM